MIEQRAGVFILTPEEVERVGDFDGVKRENGSVAVIVYDEELRELFKAAMEQEGLSIEGQIQDQGQ